VWAVAADAACGEVNAGQILDAGPRSFVAGEAAWPHAVSTASAALPTCNHSWQRSLLGGGRC